MNKGEIKIEGYTFNVNILCNEEGIMRINMVEDSIKTEYEAVYTNEEVEEFTGNVGIKLTSRDIYNICVQGLKEKNGNVKGEFREDERDGKNGLERTILMVIQSEFRNGKVMKKSSYIFPISSKLKPFAERMEKFVVDANTKLKNINRNCEALSELQDTVLMIQEKTYQNEIHNEEIKSDIKMMIGMMKNMMVTLDATNRNADETKKFINEVRSGVQTKLDTIMRKHDD